ncbi:MAG: hypothetical protein V8S22_03315 [Lachnospiraceae bacterium]
MWKVIFGSCDNRRTIISKNERKFYLFRDDVFTTMVLWMSIYNVTLHMGVLNFDTICAAWLGFPIAYVFLHSAATGSWFPELQKDLRFAFLVKPDSSVMRKVICISSCMVVPMVIIMSMYGSVRGMRKIR